MLKIQNKYIDYLEKITQELSKVSLAGVTTENLALKTKIDLIENQELIVPIIGAFSAGKSSLLNSFLNRNYLPVGITPETALASELRYSQEEYIEAIDTNGHISKFKIDEMDKIVEIADNFRFLKIYINSNKLKEIEPLVLVDMPGFESPLDIHNQAIMEYISKGVHYIVLTGVEDGTITRSMIRQLRDIKEYGRDFSFFLSKTNLRAKAEVDDVIDNLQEQIEEYFDIQKDVIPIDDDGGESFRKMLLDIDPEYLFENLFLDSLKSDYFTITETLNTTISSLTKDKQKNEEVIEELKQSLQTLQREKERLISEAKDNYSDSSIKRVVNSVGKELSSSIEELTASAITGGQDAMTHHISDIVRHVLITSLKDSMTDISDNIVDNFSASLSSLNTSMSDFTMSENWLLKLTDSTKDILKGSENLLHNVVDNRNKSRNNNKIYKILTTVLATTTTILTPIIELVIIFLPELLGGLFEKYQQQKQKEQIEKAILTQVIPSLKRELRHKLPEIFNQQIQEMIQDICNRFESIIEEKQQTIELAQKEFNEDKQNIENTIQLYKAVSDNITAITNNTLY